MRFRLKQLTLTCKRDVIEIGFEDFTYFYGEMGAGKSTIARLIDYCLGGSLERTPALQSEFVSAALDLEINGQNLNIERADRATSVIASWGTGDAAEQLSIPARKPDGVLLPNTQVEVLSDLIFHLAGVNPPRVRRSRINEDSGLERLSFRDLWWYCYLDQESIDSNFFHLDAESDTFKRKKSRTVLGFLLGYNQQRVAELETQLDEVRSQRSSLEDAAHTMTESLTDAGFDTEVDIALHIQDLQNQQETVLGEINAFRSDIQGKKTHEADRLSEQARELVHELSAIENARSQVEETVSKYKRHLNEMLALGTKVKRVASARAVLNGLEFEQCPRCVQSLPKREMGLCKLCGQTEPDATDSSVEVTDQDLSSRKKELREMIEERSAQLRALGNREKLIQERKLKVDQSYTDEMQRYDTMYLSNALAAERKKAAITEEIRYLGKILALRKHVSSLRDRARKLREQEAGIREELKEARAAAEQDATNLNQLKKLFLDCLLRSKIAGFEEDDSVSLAPPHFLPEVTGVGTGDIAITSFATIGSGGKKTLFKCCFAIAVHRLVHKLKGVLPTLLIVDTPMKNISERENREQFEGFHQMLYELAEGELSGTQFLLVDKEFSPPPANHGFSFVSRHMTVDGDEDPPLIPYYRERAIDRGIEDDSE